MWLVKGMMMKRVRQLRGRQMWREVTESSILSWCSLRTFIVLGKSFAENNNPVVPNNTHKGEENLKNQLK